MIVKDMGYSEERLGELLSQMQGVLRKSRLEFSYKSVQISLQAKEKRDLFGSLRTTMTLDGENSDIDEFYTKFLINHTTMGG